MSLYAKKDYAAAGDKFNEAEQAVPARGLQEAGSRAAFDAGCAFQQKGDADKAKESVFESAVPSRDKAARGGGSI